MDVARDQILMEAKEREEALVELKRRQVTMDSTYIRSRSSPDK